MTVPEDMHACSHYEICFCSYHLVLRVLGANGFLLHTCIFKSVKRILKMMQRRHTNVPHSGAVRQTVPPYVRNSGSGYADCWPQSLAQAGC